MTGVEFYFPYLFCLACSDFCLTDEFLEVYFRHLIFRKLNRRPQISKVPLVLVVMRQLEV